ncbi:MAG TPA: hypothetical protein VF868_12760 [Bacteroidia bacterium]|jgi:hypothetical protein
MNPFNQKVKGFYVFLFILFLTGTTYAQTTKPHFLIKNTRSAEENDKIYEGIKDIDFRAHRFYSKRRVIKFSNSPVEVELFSAKELEELYSRPVSPLTLMNNVPKEEVEFFYHPGGVVKMIIKK